MMNKHLTQEELKKLKLNLLPIEEKLAAVSHISECAQCAEALAESYQNQELLKPSPDWMLSTLGKTKQIPIPMTKNKGQNRKRELYFYGFKVSVAACIALMLLFSGTFHQGLVAIDAGKVAHTDFSKINTITKNLRGFSDKLIHIDEFGGY